MIKPSLHCKNKYVSLRDVFDISFVVALYETPQNISHEDFLDVSRRDVLSQIFLHHLYESESPFQPLTQLTVMLYKGERTT